MVIAMLHTGKQSLRERDLPLSRGEEVAVCLLIQRGRETAACSLTSGQTHETGYVPSPEHGRIITDPRKCLLTRVSPRPCCGAWCREQGLNSCPLTVKAHSQILPRQFCPHSPPTPPAQLLGWKPCGSEVVPPSPSLWAV